MIEVLKQMVEALEWCHGGEPIGTADAIAVGKKLIAELESQEPVAYLCEPDENGLFGLPTSDKACENCFPVYRHPQRTWVGLTDEEIVGCATGLIVGGMEFAKAIEAKLKERNA